MSATPMKSMPYGENSSFAAFQGSWSKGLGSRSGSAGGSRWLARWSSRRAAAYSGLRLRQLAWVFWRRAVWQSELLQALCRLPTRGFGWNRRPQIAHGRFFVFRLASGIVMTFHRCHHLLVPATGRL